MGSDQKKIHASEFFARLPFYKIVFKDYLKLVGSVAISGAGNDLDVLIDGEPLRAVEFNLKRMFPPSIAERLHVFHDQGPFTSYIPLADLVLQFKPPMVESLSVGKSLEPEGRKSAREDKVVPFRFFFPQKTRAGYHKREFFTVEDALEVAESKWYPWVGEEKLDGMLWEVHKVGDRVEVFSEDGREVNINQAGPLINEIRSQPEDFVAVGELETWLAPDAAKKFGEEVTSQKMFKGKVHVGRAKTTGYIHSSKFDREFAEGLRLTFHTLVWWGRDGKDDFHKKPEIERLKILDRIVKEGEHIRKVYWRLLKRPKDVRRFWVGVLRERGYLEGIMLKPAMERYYLNPNQGHWVKVKKLYELKVRILARERGKTKEGVPLNVYRFACAIEGKKGNPVWIGWTYHRRFKKVPKVGDVIEVRFQNLNKYTDPKTGKIWMNWWCPVVVSDEPESAQPDSVVIAERMVAASKGDVSTKRPPKDVRDIMRGVGVEFQMTSDEVLEILERTPPLDSTNLAKVSKNPAMPKEMVEAIEKARSFSVDKQVQVAKSRNYGKIPPHFGVFQLHFRGKSLHIDFRFLLPDRASWSGKTILNQIEGVPSEPVTAIEEAKRFANMILKKKAEVSKFYPGMPSGQGVVVIPKFEGKSSFLEWLVLGAAKVDWPHAGATKEFPGVFYPLDFGWHMQTVDKPWFEEHWIFFKHFRGRLVFRALPASKKYKGRIGKAPIFWRAHFANPESPPYVFSRSFFDDPEDWVPVDSALPPHWEAVVPKDLRWWEQSYSKKKRLSMIVEAHNALIEQGYLKGRPISLSSSLERAKWVLHEISWKGPIHVRGEWISTYYLRLFGPNGIETFAGSDNPLLAAKGTKIPMRKLPADEVPLPPQGKDQDDWLRFEGKIPPKRADNPNLEIEADCSIIESGVAEIERDASLRRILLRLEGENLKGYYTLQREGKGSPLFSFEKVK